MKITARQEINRGCKYFDYYKDFQLTYYKGYVCTIRNNNEAKRLPVQLEQELDESDIHYNREIKRFINKVLLKFDLGQLEDSIYRQDFNLEINFDRFVAYFSGSRDKGEAYIDYRAGKYVMTIKQNEGEWFSDFRVRVIMKMASLAIEEDLKAGKKFGNI